MKIVGVDNFNTETVSDLLVAENIQHKLMAECMCAALNKDYSGDNAPRFYEVKPDDYVLYRYEP